MELKTLPRRVVRKFFHTTLPFWQMLGFNITPVHFYDPIPELKKLTGIRWDEESAMKGVDFNEREQVELVSCFKNFKKEFQELEHDHENTEFGPLDAYILYGMVRHFQPKRIIEVGAGYSTMLMAQAVEKNGNTCQLTSIDPYPKNFVVRYARPYFQLLQKRIQDIPLEQFRELVKNDILFIDSSHVVKTGSDLHYLFLHVLPHLAPGVIVHFHDIFLPHEYPKDWVVKEHRFWNEQYFLQAFLTSNSEWKVLCSAHLINYKHPHLLDIPSRAAVPAGSFWIQRI